MIWTVRLIINQFILLYGEYDTPNPFWIQKWHKIIMTIRYYTNLYSEPPWDNLCHRSMSKIKRSAHLRISPHHYTTIISCWFVIVVFLCFVLSWCTFLSLGSVGTCLRLTLEGFGSPWCESISVVAFEFKELSEMWFAVYTPIQCCISARTGKDRKEKKGKKNAKDNI